MNGRSGIHRTNIDKERGMKTRLLLTALVVVAAAWANVASATIITYTDRTLWTNAMPSVDYTVDFESFVADTSFALVPLDVGPFTLSTIGTAVPGTNLVDVSPFTCCVVPASFGNVAVDIFVDVGLMAEIVFDTPVQGFFADFFAAGNTFQLTLTLADGSSTMIQVPGPGNSLEPFGFISTSNAIMSIEFSNTLNDGFFVDNISAGNAVSVPEPGTLALLGIGLAGMGLMRRRRKV